MNTDDIKKLAHLARLDVPETELAKVATEMDSIMTLVAEIQNVEVPSGESRDLVRTNLFRADVVDPIVPVHDLVEVATLHQDHFVKVPKVIGE